MSAPVAMTVMSMQHARMCMGHIFVLVMSDLLEAERAALI